MELSMVMRSDSPLSLRPEHIARLNRRDGTRNRDRCRSGYIVSPNTSPLHDERRIGEVYKHCGMANIHSPPEPSEIGGFKVTLRHSLFVRERLPWKIACRFLGRVVPSWTIGARRTGSDAVWGGWGRCRCFEVCPAACEQQ